MPKRRRSQYLLQGFRQCTMCKRVLPETEEYFRLRQSIQLFFAKCHPCERKHEAKKRKDNPERFSETQKRFRLNNPEQSRAIKQKWTDANPDKIREKSRERYERDKVVIRERQLKYDLNHPEKKRQRSQKRRALMKNADGHHSAQDIARQYEDQNGLCFFCGIRMFWGIRHDTHVEHLTPLSRGGSNWPDNIVISCADCNLSKHQKTLQEWIEARGW